MSTCIPPGVIVAGIESALNRYLSLDPESHRQLSLLSGRVLALHLKPIDVLLFFVFTDNGVTVLDSLDEQPDTRITATPGALLRLSVKFAGRPDPEDFTVSGDTHLAQAFQSMLTEADIDWEEQLSVITGDILAHQAGKFVRAAKMHARHSRAAFSEDLAEYLKVEKNWLPERDEMEVFLTAVDDLRSRVEQLAARVVRLEASHVEPKS